jgi:hypothetical protein
MNTEEPSYGPLQMLLVGFETTERFRGEIVRELLDLRGRGMIRVLDARFMYRERDGTMTEVDLGPLLADRPHDDADPIARLLGCQRLRRQRRCDAIGGVRAHGRLRAGGSAQADGRDLARRVRRGVLVEHVWAGRLSSVVRRTGGALLGQGFLTGSGDAGRGGAPGARRR